ncbi:protein ALEX-like [Choloepus didactylus]|uniref:protein ALEX-like n=1 Tax=Choloepus didactylus TaxID=27675 RepID=UPI00189FF5E6|nr:protein ALEX-like [Choloepus didactylus]
MQRPPREPEPRPPLTPGARHRARGLDSDPKGLGLLPQPRRDSGTLGPHQRRPDLEPSPLRVPPPLCQSSRRGRKRAIGRPFLMMGKLRPGARRWEAQGHPATQAARRAGPAVSPPAPRGRAAARRRPRPGPACRQRDLRLFTVALRVSPRKVEIRGGNREPEAAGGDKPRHLPGGQGLPCPGLGLSPDCSKDYTLFQQDWKHSLDLSCSHQAPRPSPGPV